MEGGLAHAELSRNSAIPKKIHGWIFLGQGRTPPWSPFSTAKRYEGYRRAERRWRIGAVGRVSQGLGGRA